jgi:hypothetical protein
MEASLSRSGFGFISKILGARKLGGDPQQDHDTQQVPAQRSMHYRQSD